ncbi:ribonuclease T2 family protein [Kushneria sinocarnis]|nr:ribonuclease I [Kushneria sinocarnis]
MTGRMLKRVGIGLLALGMMGEAMARSLSPTRLTDFEHYTLALSWHPGFCHVEGRGRAECATDTPDGLLVLHGLWPSLPQQLRQQGVAQSEWWQAGCYHFSGEPRGGFCRLTPLTLEDRLQGRLEQAMPGTRSCLERHEYTKHAACFGLSAQDYFSTALQLYRRINASDWSDFMRLRAGTMVARETLLARFREEFRTDSTRALRLDCERREGVAWLTGIAIGIQRRALDAFPQPRSLAPLEPGSCPSRFLIAAPS